MSRCSLRFTSHDRRNFSRRAPFELFVELALTISFSVVIFDPSFFSNKDRISAHRSNQLWKRPSGKFTLLKRFVRYLSPFLRSLESKKFGRKVLFVPGRLAFSRAHLPTSTEGQSKHRLMQAKHIFQRPISLLSLIHHIASLKVQVSCPFVTPGRP